MKRCKTLGCITALLAALVIPAMAWGGDARYFADNCLHGALSWNNPPSQAIFHSGQYDRTYVAYLGDDFYAYVTYYDHDAKQWAEPVKVDDCVHNDGHNAPEILITRDGHIHLFYGTHNSPIKYARNLYPEDITRWRIGKMIGDRVTYPRPLQVNNGDLLCFCR